MGNVGLLAQPIELKVYRNICLRMVINMMFDVASLLTNVPIKRTVDLISKRIYTDKLVSTNLKKRTLKKLILDTCTKTAFSFNNKLYQQKDGVTMGCSLGAALTNIIMTELEEVVIKPLIANGTNKFYTRFVDDTLLVIKFDMLKKYIIL